MLGNRERKKCAHHSGWSTRKKNTQWKRLEGKYTLVQKILLYVPSIVYALSSVCTRNFSPQMSVKRHWTPSTPASPSLKITAEPNALPRYLVCLGLDTYGHSTLAMQKIPKNFLGSYRERLKISPNTLLRRRRSFGQPDY